MDAKLDNRTRKAVDSCKGLDKKRILFVCLGNICRSPVAEEIMRSVVKERGESDRYELDSAGLYGGHAGQLPDPRMRAHAIRRGYNLTHRSRPVRELDFDDFDLIIGMDDNNISSLRRMAPTIEDEAKVVSMAKFCRRHPWADHVPDPYYDGAEGFENVLDLLEDACQSLADALE